MRRAFTLVELLVVVTVIVVLAAILLPVFVRTIEQSRRAECVNNLRQLGTAIRIYMDDWNNRYPAASEDYNVDPGRSMPMLHRLLMPYVRDESVWICPSDTGETFWSGPFGYRGRTIPLHRMEKRGMTSYSYFGYGRTDAWGELAGKKESWIKNPSIGVLMVETRPWHSPCDPSDNYYTSPAFYDVLYCDQHIGYKSAPVWLQEQKAAIYQ